MFNFMIIEIILAYALDLVLGDPRWMPHPVKGMGVLINKLEPILRRAFRSPRLGGIILALSVIGVSWCGAFMMIKLASSVNIYLGSAVSVLIIYSSLAVKDLDVESAQVYNALMEEDIVSARKNLSLIVGRDTDSLERCDVARATVETVAENIVDGIISPLFYAFIGGAPLSLAYKAVNTLDSMVGYKNDRYKDFGWASARIDTIANFIPSRLSIIFLSAASLITGKNAVNAWKISVRDGRKNPSLNSGIPEAAIAGALGVRLGGLNYYNSKPVSKPFIGDDINQLEAGHIKDSIRISYVSSVLFVIAGVIITVCIGRG